MARARMITSTIASSISKGTAMAAANDEVLVSLVEAAGVATQNAPLAMVPLGQELRQLLSSTFSVVPHGHDVHAFAPAAEQVEHEGLQANNKDVDRSRNNSETSKRKSRGVGCVLRQAPDAK